MQENLKSFLASFSALLDYENHHQWSHWMNSVEKMVDANAMDAYDHYSKAFGGAGTLNDIHFQDPWSFTLFWKLRAIIGIYFQCLELDKDIKTQLSEFQDEKLESLKVHCCSHCQSRFVTQRDLIATQIPAKINTLILEDIFSSPMKTLYERFAVLRKTSSELLEELTETIDEDWEIVRSDPWYQPCAKCNENSLKLQSYKYDGLKWSMLT
ncbi:hypothetical protein BMS_2356 [Halobacteriovorax marinus SJ]|uniref:Uncharacterized protein n=1 Tax=Halobacteriovorax marinus (strain ATCC BAA-682 / DSM 15412 / SJ) TaxID=862908 RepID=E1X4S7_HALMS|nr:hypothetical protein [Halobacteriovorax marinus]CBW27153.1 hypothetical protein BMS_2356 [Halobacteriovorax marinus SJ]